MVNVSIYSIHGSYGLWRFPKIGVPQNGWSIMEIIWNQTSNMFWRLHGFHYFFTMFHEPSWDIPRWLWRPWVHWHPLMGHTHTGVSWNGVPQNGWFIMANPIKMDDLGGTPISGNPHMSSFRKTSLVADDRRNILSIWALSWRWFVIHGNLHSSICICFFPQMTEGYTI